MLRIIWRAGCLETCTSGSGLGSGGSSWAYTTCVLPSEMRIWPSCGQFVKLCRGGSPDIQSTPEGYHPLAT